MSVNVKESKSNKKDSIGTKQLGSSIKEDNQYFVKLLINQNTELLRENGEMRKKLEKCIRCFKEILMENTAYCMDRDKVPLDENRRWLMYLMLFTDAKLQDAVIPNSEMPKGLMLKRCGLIRSTKNRLRKIRQEYSGDVSGEGLDGCEDSQKESKQLGGEELLQLEQLKTAIGADMTETFIPKYTVRRYLSSDFLSTELGKSIVKCVKAWDTAVSVIEQYGGCEKYSDKCQHAQEVLKDVLGKWEIYKMAVRQFYGIELFLVRDKSLFGVVMENADWELYVCYFDRKLPDKSLLRKIMQY